MFVPIKPVFPQKYLRWLAGTRPSPKLGQVVRFRTLKDRAHLLSRPPATASRRHVRGGEERGDVGELRAALPHRDDLVHDLDLTGLGVETTTSVTR
jgi:hypothetical protein